MLLTELRLDDKINSVAQRVVRWAARQGLPPAGLFHAGTLSKGESRCQTDLRNRCV
jgi:hypothetical protein